MSGPAGGVSGAIWVGEQAGINNVITFDMGGTSTDVALIEKWSALVRRETTVGDVTVRASALDVRSIGAGEWFNRPRTRINQSSACRT